MAGESQFNDSCFIAGQSSYYVFRVWWKLTISGTGISDYFDISDHVKPAPCVNPNKYYYWQQCGQ